MGEEQKYLIEKITKQLLMMKLGIKFKKSCKKEVKAIIKGQEMEHLEECLLLVE